MDDNVAAVLAGVSVLCSLLMVLIFIVAEAAVEIAPKKRQYVRSLQVGGVFGFFIWICIAVRW